MPLEFIDEAQARVFHRVFNDATSEFSNVVEGPQVFVAEQRAVGHETPVAPCLGGGKHGVDMLVFGARADPAGHLGYASTTEGRRAEGRSVMGIAAAL